MKLRLRNELHQGREVRYMLGWQACLRCGRKTEGDCLLYKGGVSRVLCPACEQLAKAESRAVQGKMNRKKQ